VAVVLERALGEAWVDSFHPSLKDDCDSLNTLIRAVRSLSRSLIPQTSQDSIECLGVQYTGLLCLMATGVHLLMVISGFIGGNRRELWELVFLVVTSIAYLLWRFGRGSPAAHLSRSRLICNILSLLACLRWLAIWAVPDPETAFINVVSGLLYLPLLLGCLILLGGSRASIHGLIGFFSLTPLLLGQQAVILDTPFSDWRLGPSIAGAYIVYRQLLMSVLSLKTRMRGLVVDNEKLSRDVILDPLTATLNRRGLRLKRHQISAQCSGLILLDIDFFKAINDTHGHLIGDQVLIEIAATLKSRLRARDLICRWGGEEFLIMVELVDHETQAEANLNQLAAALLQAVRDINWDAISAELKTVTASAGTTILQRGMAFQTCVDAADYALLQAKRSGRNRVMAAIHPR